MRQVTALSTRSVCKLYRSGRSVVRGLAPLSIDVEIGEAVALTGANGSGKTTALKIAATLIEPTSGTVTIFGRDTERDPGFVRSAVGVVLASTRAFYWRLSAEHNLSFFAALHGVVPRRARERAGRLADELGLREYLGLPARMLSRGVLARLAIARALLHEPPLLLMDEPFASIDASTRELVWDALGRRKRAGLAVLVATHDSSQVERCERSVSLQMPA